MWFGKQKERDLEALRDIEDDVEESDYVPYACLYDEHTILTKNGEVLQTIKVTGLSREVLGAAAKDLREVIRATVKAHIPNDSFAIWLHTIRREQNLASGGNFPYPFAEQLNNAWMRENRFERQFINEVYISIAIEGQDARISNPTVFMRGLLPALDKKWRFGYIEEIQKKLNHVVEKMLVDLAPYGAKRLGFYERDGVYYSEQCRFLEKLINLVDRPMPVAAEDLSTYLTAGDVTFSYNAMEVRTFEGKRRFGTILTLKEYKEASLPAIDKFLQLPMEFIVTQCVNFVNPAKAFEKYKNQKYYFDIGGAHELADWSEVNRILSGDRGKPNDFGEQQISIFLLADSLRHLDFNVKSSVRFLGEHGLVTVREDLKFEECYWAQLPGNFIFVNRMAPTDTLHIGGFANLSNYPVGTRQGHWGDAVSTFHTANGTPYFFNFHHEGNGHTIMIGPSGSGKSVLMHFLIAQATKFNPQLFYFDLYGSAGSMMRALGGNHLLLSASSQEPFFNPFWLKAGEETSTFLLKLFGVMVRAGGGSLTPEDKAALGEVIARMYTQPESMRTFNTFYQSLASLSPSAAAALQPWSNGGRFAAYFSHPSGSASFAKLQSFDLRALEEEPLVFAAVASYLIQLVSEACDGSPTIIVLNQAWNTLKMTHVAEKVQSWLSQLEKANALAIMATDSVDQAAAESFTPGLLAGVATQFYMPDEAPSASYQSVFGLNPVEFAYLEAMDPEERHFLLKQNQATIVAGLDLSQMGEFLTVLAGKRPREATLTPASAVA